MKKILFILVSIIALQVNAQEAKKEVKNEENRNWTVGFGVNFVDNTSTYNNQFLNVSKQWNSITTISKVSAERSITSLFSAEASFTANRLTKDKLQNGVTVFTDANYLAFDVNGKFYFDEFIAENSKLDAFIALGTGINTVNAVYNGTGNYGLGFNYWVEPNIGLRVQTLGKYAFEQQTICNNHIQHSVELIFKF